MSSINQYKKQQEKIHFYLLFMWLLYNVIPNQIVLLSLLVWYLDALSVLIWVAKVSNAQDCNINLEGAGHIISRNKIILRSLIWIMAKI
jgi:hypothetical protein